MHITPVHRMKSCSSSDFASTAEAHQDWSNQVWASSPHKTKPQWGQSPEKHHLFLRWRVEDQALSSESEHFYIHIPTVRTVIQWVLLRHELKPCALQTESVRDKCEMKTKRQAVWVVHDCWLFCRFLNTCYYHSFEESDMKVNFKFVYSVQTVTLQKHLKC